MKQNKKGFTLVELLVVIVVLSLLIALAMPTVLDVMKNSQKKIYADQLLAYAKDVTNVFAEQKSELGADAPLCYIIDTLKPATKNKGCIQLDYDTGQPTNMYIYNDTYTYGITAGDDYLNLADKNGKAISDIGAGLTSSVKTVIDTSCQTCNLGGTAAVAIP